MKKEIKFVLSLLIPFIAGAIGGLFTSSSVNSWYVTLDKPFFNPPSWLFGPVWTLLYVLIGISLFLVWSKTNEKRVFWIFGIQMFLNTMWSIAFFGLKNPFLGIVVILPLLATIIWMIIEFYKINKTASMILIPYALWVGFASILNIFIYLLNA